MTVGLIVQKYGGTSVANPEQIKSVARHIAKTVQAGNKVAVIVSAMGTETNDLLELADATSSTQPNRELDMLITAGERKAAALLCMALADIPIEASSLTGSQAGLKTDTSHQKARIQGIQPDRIEKLLEADVIPVVAGSQGVSGEKQVTFLGRGGSDTTAVVLAHALDAEICELYTDVDGIFTADPRIVKNAQPMKNITYDELLDMTATGCPKPAMRAVEIARNFGVPLHIRSAFSWESGTRVNLEAMEQAIISAVTHDLSEAKITISGVPDEPGVAANLFRTLADMGVNVDMIVQNVSSQGFTDISFTMPRSELNEGLKATRDFGEKVGAKDVSANTEIARVSLVGAGMKTHPGVAATVFETLGNHKINIQMISTSSIRISCVISEAEAEQAVNALHSAFNLHSDVEDSAADMKSGS